VLLAEFDAVGLGVEDILIAASSCDMSDIFAVMKTEVTSCRDASSSKFPNSTVVGRMRSSFLYPE
jgi:hypothetical protein